jgi:hypothetical protein
MSPRREAIVAAASVLIVAALVMLAKYHWHLV